MIDTDLPAAPSKLKRFGWVLLSAWMLVVFLLSSFVIPGVFSPEVELYMAQPLLWLSMAGLAVWLRLREGEGLALLAKRDLILTGAMIGAIQVAVSVLLGVVLGFGNSPYSRQVLWVLLNLWYAGALLVGLETARWYLGVSAGRKSQALGFFLAWLLPLILMIPVGKYGQLAQTGSAFRAIGQTFLPGGAESLLAASLAMAGGPLASIAYRGVMLAFEWISPILPDLPWMAAAFVGVLVPVVGLLLTGQSDEPAPVKVEQTAKKPGSERASVTSWLLVGMLAVGLIWFNTGALGVRPSLISGNSMNPALYPGDVVVTGEMQPQALQVGDVIRFPRDGIDVVHRIIAVEEQNGQYVFVTQGDNNNVADDPVPAELVQGKVIVTIPKIGWVGILFRQALAGLRG
jgi:signal peptidase